MRRVLDTHESRRLEVTAEQRAEEKRAHDAWLLAMERTQAGWQDTDRLWRHYQAIKARNKGGPRAFA